MNTSNIDRAAAAWGQQMPGWVAVLARECDTTSQRKVAVRLGYSAGTINGILKNKWPASTAAIEQAVREAYMAATVICPVLGQIDAEVCRYHQGKPYANTNSLRVRLYRACREGCHHSQLEQSHAAAQG